LATSGSTDYTRTRDQIIRGALRAINVIAAGETPSSEDMQDGAEALNLMVKSWQTEGVYLWTHTEATLFLAYGTSSYSVGPSGWHATETYADTELTAAAALGATSLTVGSVTGITAADHIGIELDDGTRQWTTVSTAAGTTVTIGAALTGAAASGNSIFAYTTKLERPLKIIEARRRDSAGNDLPLRLISRDEYMRLPTKATTGTVTQVYYDPQLTNGVLYTWPTASDVDDILRFTFRRTVEDFDGTANTPDFPQEWLAALKFNLAIHLAPEYEKEVSTTLAALALSTLDGLRGWDKEDTPTFFGVDMMGGTG
jgi:hypothetical protein